MGVGKHKSEVAFVDVLTKMVSLSCPYTGQLMTHFADQCVTNLTHCYVTRLQHDQTVYKDGQKAQVVQDTSGGSMCLADVSARAHDSHNK